VKEKVYELQDIKINAADLSLCETLFHNANGYIGIRSCFEEGYPDRIKSIRGTYINGFYEYADMPQAENLRGLAEEKRIMLNIADTQGIRLFLDDEEFNLWGGMVTDSRRTLNMSGGYSERYVHWHSPNGKEAEIRIRRLASFTRPCLFLIEYSVKALNFSGTVHIISAHKADVENSGHLEGAEADAKRYLDIINSETEKNASFFTAETIKSKLKVCTAVDHVFSKDANIKTAINNNTAACTIDAQISQNESITLHKYSVFCDSAPDCLKKAKEELANSMAAPAQTLFQEQREYLDKYWNNALLEIEGDDELQQAIQFNMYQLLQTAGKEGQGIVAAKGLCAQGYDEHYSRDTEIYIEPFFVISNPEIARNLISYRYDSLEQAKKNALHLGYKTGALFPWRANMDNGCAAAQYHINGDIAWSVVFYYLVTGDLDFIAHKGAELVFECARLWIDAGIFHEGQFRINNVSGPDQYSCAANNNYYTNIGAKRNLEWAVKFYELLKKNGKLSALAEKIKLDDNEVSVFAEAAQGMYLPYDEKTGINPQDDSFLLKKRVNPGGILKENFPLPPHYHPLFLYRHQICKQADTVLAHIIFDDAPLKTMINSFLYYEDITVRDSSLSNCVFSIAASRYGFYEEAYEYFSDSAKLDFLFKAGYAKDGLHIANIGGTFMAIIFGFMGLKVKESGIYISPYLPKRWKTCRFKLRYGENLIEVTIDTDTIQLSLVSGGSVPVYIYDKLYNLTYTVITPVKNTAREIQKYKAVFFSSKVIHENINTDARSILKHLKSMGIKTVVIDSDDKYVKPGKIYLKTAASLIVAVNQTLVVENTITGIDTAYAEGFHCAAMGDAHNSANAKIKLDKLAQLFYLV